MLDCIAASRCLLARAVAPETPFVLSLADLPFNPIRLILLIGWVYLCVYLVQRVHFSPLVPKNCKTAANVVTLLTGPFLLLTLFLVDTARKTQQTRESFCEVLMRQAKKALMAIRSRRSEPEEDDSALRLLDSSGRSIDEIYGHSDTKRADARVLNLTETTIADALDRRASDLLIDPKNESAYTVRLRIDGVLRVVEELDADTCRAVINSVKAVAGMDISERRRPQDGGFMAKRGASTASFRVASAGVLYGEKLSIRVLNKDAGSFTLADVGFSEKQYARIQDAIQKPAGMILLCGPTGSGKTTSLYATLNEIDRFTRNVITVEDPIEAVLPEASQIEINPKADITFAKTLRSVLRQDPDVICVGEIRDEIRLLDLGVSPLLLSAGLNLVVSQRLVRCLCKHCKEPAHLSDSQINGLEKKGIDHSHVFEAIGCKHCEQTGYLGRTAIGELMIVDDALKAEIAKSESLIARLRTEGSRKGISGLRKAGLKKVVMGVTSLEELKRVVG